MSQNWFTQINQNLYFWHLNNSCCQNLIFGQNQTLFVRFFVKFLGCELEDLAHYHCKDEGCEMIFRHEEGAREHGRNHFIQDQISEMFFVRGDPEDDHPDCSEITPNCPHLKTGLHWHCKWVSKYY